VLAFELELGLLVVIEPRLLPLDLVVAVFALLAQAALVALVVVLPVAGIAVRRRVAELLPRLVAVVAAVPRVLVAAAQFEVGAVVIELLPVELGDFGIPALMVGMAFPAGLVFEAAVQPRVGPDVGRGVLVAVQAQVHLGGLVELLVALLALLFVFRVSLDDRAGHQGLFHLADLRHCRRCGGDDEQDGEAA
jgi:hypothetical protein